MATKVINKFEIFIFIFFLIFSIQSCFLLKHSTTRKVLNISNINDSITKRNIDFDTISFKMLIHYSSRNKNIQLYSDVNIVKDSVILIKVYLPLGIKVANIFLSPDSVLFYFPIQNTYSFGKSSFFLNKYNIALNFNSIQSLLIGKFFPYPYFSTKRMYDIYADSLFHISNKIHNKRNTKIISVQSDFSYKNDYLLHYVSIQDFILKRSFFVKYFKYSVVNNKYFPSSMDININSISDTLKLGIKTKNLKFNSNSNFHIKLPSNAKILN